MSEDEKSKQPKAKTNVKKRKRPRLSPEEQFQQERKERYSKLVHMSTKAIHKEAKVVKSFECQKIVRKLKEDKSNTKLAKKLEHAKGFSLDRVVKLCQLRMGIPNLDPDAEEVEDNKGVTDEMPQDEELLERMLKHKRLVVAVDTWNEKVTEYRKWLLRREDSVNGVPHFMGKTNSTQPTLKKKNKNKNGTDSDNKKASSGSGNDLFVTLSGAAIDEEQYGGHPGSYYGPASGEVYDEYASIVKPKKNRAGQRQRKCKAMAIQAKKEGRTWDSSANWRAKKSKDIEGRDASTSGHNQNDDAQKPIKAKPSEIAAMGKEWKDEGKAHPSWAAKQTQKSGIVAFAGKKITFD